MNLGRNIVAEWRCTREFIEVPDLFRVEPCWDVHDWDELMKLQNDLVSMSQKYLFFSDVRCLFT